MICIFLKSRLVVASERNSLGNTTTALLLCLCGVWLCSASAHLHKQHKGVNWGVRPRVTLMCDTGSNTTGTGGGLECHEQLCLMHLIYGWWRALAHFCAATNLQRMERNFRRILYWVINAFHRFMNNKKNQTGKNHWKAWVTWQAWKVSHVSILYLFFQYKTLFLLNLCPLLC